MGINILRRRRVIYLRNIKERKHRINFYTRTINRLTVIMNTKRNQRIKNVRHFNLIYARRIHYLNKKTRILNNQIRKFNLEMHRDQVKFVRYTAMIRRFKRHDNYLNKQHYGRVRYLKKRRILQLRNLSRLQR